MQAATRPNSLEKLENLLQARLRSHLVQSQLSPGAPVQVRCLLKEGTLVILVQHPTDVVLNPQETFEILKQIILAQEQLVSPQVKIYLRVAGQKQPYAFHSFAVEPNSASTTTTTHFEGVPDASDLQDSPMPESFDSSEGEEDYSQHTQPSADGEDLPHPWDGPVSESESEVDELTQETSVPEKIQSKRTLIPLVATGAGLGVFAFALSLFVLSRPCVVGRCKAIPAAQQLSQRSLQTLQNPQSGKEVLEAQEQLNLAIRTLESVPYWSGRHDEAQALAKDYQVKSERVEDMVDALKTAARAGYKSQNPPHAPTKWIEIQSLWREAIAQLELLPPDSNLQPLAQQKIKDYKTKLAQTNQRLIKERQAQGRLQEAKDAALIAQARQGVAQSLQHWQLVYATWQVAMNRLKQIPQGTTAYEEAQQLRALYTPKMTSARDRKTQEQIAAKAYDRGVRLAQQAQSSQSENQWTTAVTNWRNAMTYLKQVPSDSFYYPKAQSLARSYQGAYKQAQGQLQLAIKMQQARSDLNQTCYGKTKVCIYSINNNLIKVRLTPLYLQMVRQTALAARNAGDGKAQAGVVNHILTLGQALEAISDNAQLPVQLYNPDGTLIETHSPG
jgi:hypothetical protein